MDFQDSIDLKDGNYVIGISAFNTYNSIFNITSENNKLMVFDGLLYWKVLVIPPGAYEIEQINDEITRQLQTEAESLGDNHKVLEDNTATLHSVIYLKLGYKIDFSQPVTSRELLGFESIVLSNPYNYSENKVNIIDIH